MKFKILLSCLSCLVVLALLVTSCKNTTTTENQASDAPKAPGDSSERILEKEAFKSGMNKSNTVIVDVRMPEEYAQGHIEGAVNINFFDPQFKNQLLELDKKKTYYLYCKNERRSYRSMKFMEDNDFKNVYMLKGGYEKWNTPATE